MPCGRLASLGLCCGHTHSKNVLHSRVATTTTNTNVTSWPYQTSRPTYHLALLSFSLPGALVLGARRFLHPTRPSLPDLLCIFLLTIPTQLGPHGQCSCCCFGLFILTRSGLIRSQPRALNPDDSYRYLQGVHLVGPMMQCIQTGLVRI